MTKYSIAESCALFSSDESDNGNDEMAGRKRLRTTMSYLKESSNPW